MASDGDSYRVGNSLSLSLFFSFMYHCFFLYCCCCVSTFGILLLPPPPLLHVCDCDLEWNNPFISFHFILFKNKITKHVVTDLPADQRDGRAAEAGSDAAADVASAARGSAVGWCWRLNVRPPIACQITIIQQRLTGQGPLDFYLLFSLSVSLCSVWRNTFVIFIHCWSLSLYSLRSVCLLFELSTDSLFWWLNRSRGSEPSLVAPMAFALLSPIRWYYILLFMFLFIHTHTHNTAGCDDFYDAERWRLSIQKQVISFYDWRPLYGTAPFRVAAAAAECTALVAADDWFTASLPIVDFMMFACNAMSSRHQNRKSTTVAPDVRPILKRDLRFGRNGEKKGVAHHRTGCCSLYCTVRTCWIKY